MYENDLVSLSIQIIKKQLLATNNTKQIYYNLISLLCICQPLIDI